MNRDLRAQQVAVHVMCGGGFLGSFAARQPADFYIDDRVEKLPYPKKAIYKAVATLTEIAKEQGKNPKMLDDTPVVYLHV